MKTRKMITLGALTAMVAPMAIGSAFAQDYDPGGEGGGGEGGGGGGTRPSGFNWVFEDNNPLQPRQGTGDASISFMYNEFLKEIGLNDSAYVDPNTSMSYKQTVISACTKALNQADERNPNPTPDRPSRVVGIYGQYVNINGEIGRGISDREIFRGNAHRAYDSMDNSYFSEYDTAATKSSLRGVLDEAIDNAPSPIQVICLARNGNEPAEPFRPVPEADPNKVWTVNESGALTANDPRKTNQVGADQKTFGFGDNVSAVINDAIPHSVARFSSYSITDDWSGASKYVDFTNVSNAKVYFTGDDGVRRDVTSEFTITNSNNRTVAVANSAFLDRTEGLDNDAVVKLVINGKFRELTDALDTEGEKIELINKGSVNWNGTVKATNEPPVFIVNPDPDKVWVIDANGAIETADPEWTNSVGVDQASFTFGDPVGAVVNGRIPANKATAFTQYSITDDWTDASKYVDFSDASKARVFRDGVDVTSQFDIVVDGTRTIATAKPEFLRTTANLAEDAVMKLYIGGNFRDLTDALDTHGNRVTLTNAGSESWNNQSRPTNEPPIFITNPDPDKVWVLDEEGALATADADWTNNRGADRKVFLHGDKVGAVVNGSIQRDRAIPLASYTLIDDWTGASKYVDFTDASKAKVFRDGVDVTEQFDIVVDGTRTIARAKAEFLENTVGLEEDAVMKLYIEGNFYPFSSDLDTKGETIELTNAGSELWNDQERPTNTPPIYIWNPDPEKLTVASGREAGDQSEIGGLYVFPGQKVEYQVNLDFHIPDNLAREIADVKVKDIFSPHLIMDKASVEVYDTRNNRTIPKSDYKIEWDDEENSFTITFDGDWIEKNTSPGAESGWLILRYEGEVSDSIAAGIDPQDIVNQEFQIFNASFTQRDVIVKIPGVDPHKEVLNTNMVDINEKHVMAGDTLRYRLTLDASAPRSEYAYNVLKLGMIDDYDEKVLDLTADKISVIRKTDNVDVTDQFNIQVKDGKAAIFAKTVDTYNVTTDQTLPGDPQPEDLFAYSEQAIDAMTTPGINQDLLGHEYWIVLDATVTQDIDEYVIENTAWQNIHNQLLQTETVTNFLTEIDPSKDVSVEVGGESVDGGEIPLYSTFNYKLSSSEIPGNRAYETDNWSIFDDYAETHDQFTGKWIAIAETDIYNGEELVYKAGDTISTNDVCTFDVEEEEATEGEEATEEEAVEGEATDETIFDGDCLFTAEHDEEKGAFTFAVNDEYLNIVNSRLDLPQAWSVYTQMERLAPGTVENTFVENYNGFERIPNTVVTETPENPAISVVKYDIESGFEAGDRNSTEEQLRLTEAKDVEIGYRITNTGDVPLVNVTLTDTTLAGNAKVGDITCPETFEGRLAIGESVDCTATLSGLEEGVDHTNQADVTGESIFTGKEVKDDDPWNGRIIKPSIDVEKYDIASGIEGGDRDEASNALTLNSPEDVQIGYRITNNGDEDLQSVVLTDETFVGNARVGQIVCGDGLADGLSVGETVDCTATLSGLTYGEAHANKATVTGVGVETEREVTDNDDWHAKVNPEIVEKLEKTGASVAGLAAIGAFMALGGSAALGARRKNS